MAVCSCSAGVMWHCRTTINSICSSVPAEMLKPVKIDISRHTAFTSHLTCRSCRQFIKPTLAPPVDSLFYRHSVQSEIPLLQVTAWIIISLFPISGTNKEDNFFQNSIKRAKLIVTFALRTIKPALCCITLTYNVRFSTKVKFNIVLYSCTFQRCTCSLKVCIGFTSINIKSPQSCYFSPLHRRPPFFRRRCGLPGRLQMHIIITNILCPVFPSCYMCYLSSHIFTPVHYGRLSTLPLWLYTLQILLLPISMNDLGKENRILSLFSYLCYFA